jgi:hypothetical protein
MGVRGEEMIQIMNRQPPGSIILQVKQSKIIKTPVGEFHLNIMRIKVAMLPAQKD